MSDETLAPADIYPVVSVVGYVSRSEGAMLHLYEEHVECGL